MSDPISPRLSRFLRRLSYRADMIRSESLAEQRATIAYEDLHKYIGRRLNIGDVPLSTVDGTSRYDRFEG